MKSTNKTISIILAILMILSSFTMLSASATTLGEDGTEFDDIWSVSGDDARSVLYGFIINHSWDDESWFTEQFTEQTLTNYSTEYHNAQNVYNNESSTDEQIKQAYDSLLTAYYALEYKISNAELRQKLNDKIDELLLSMPVGGTPYTKESYSKFSQALTNAREAANNSDSKRSAIIGSGNLLTYYYNKLEYSTADRTKLWTAIEKLREVIEADGAESLSNFAELKELYNEALPVYYYEPDQSELDKYEAKIYTALGIQSGTDPVSSDINSSEPVNSDLNTPDSSESQPTDPSSSEQTSSESQATDPSSSEQTSSESQPTDPSSSEQTSSESQPTDPSSSEQTSSESVPPSSSETAPTKPTTPTKPVTYKLSKAKVASIPDKAYTGKAITPSVKVTYGKKTLAKGKDYTLTYKNNKKIGTATVEIKGKGSYTGTIKKTFKIVKAKNPMTVKVTKKTVSYKKALKARQKVSAITVTKAQGKVSFKKTKGSPNLTISSKGVVSVKQGTQKGTRHMLVKISAAGNANYKPVTKVVAITIIIK